MIDLSDLTEAELDEWESLYHDLLWYGEHAPLLVKDKESTAWVPMKARPAQRYVWARLWQMVREERLVRAAIAKARQLGMTTLFLGHKVHIANTAEGREMYVLMHDLKPALTAFRRIKAMHEKAAKDGGKRGVPENNLPRATITGEQKGRLLEFDTESSILVESVKKQGVGRSETLHHVHATEIPSWEGAEEIMDGIEESVPELYGFESSIILESTSEGVGDWWYWTVQAAKRGDSQYELIFLPWWMEPAYGALEPRPEVLKAKFRNWKPGCGTYLGDALKEPLTPGEEALGKRILKEAPSFGINYLTPEMVIQKLLWRRRKEQSRGSTKFKQEYPATVEESFQGSGRPVFSADNVIFHKERAVGALEVVVDAPQRFEVFHQDTIIVGQQERQVWNARARADGALHVWKGYEESDPNDPHHYVIGGDPSAAVIDPSALQVIKVKPDLFEQVAVFHGEIGQLELAQVTAWLAKQYGGRALIVPECTGDESYVQALAKIRWPGRRIYQREVIRPGGKAVQKVFGFDMNTSTRPAVVATIETMLASPNTIIRHAATLMEMEQFQIRKTSATGKPRPDHPDGGHSDLLMAWGIAAYARNYRRAVTRKPTVAQGPKYEASKGSDVRLPLHAASRERGTFER